MVLQFSIDILGALRDLSAQEGFAVIDDLGAYVSAIISLILTIGTLAAFIYLVWGGLKWLMAGSDKTKVEEARTQITNAIIGLTIIAASWAVFLIINYFFGLNIAQ